MQFPPPDTRISYDLLAVAASAKTSLFYLITGRIISLSDKNLLYNIWHILLKIPLCKHAFAVVLIFIIIRLASLLFFLNPKLQNFGSKVIQSESLLLYLLYLHIY